MIYIYRPQASTGARLLAERLTELGKPAQKVSRPPTMGDLTICWGAHVPGLVGGINNIPLSNKLDDALKLREAGVPTIEVSRERPAVPPPSRGILRLAHDYAIRSANGAWEYDEDGARTILERVQEYLNRPLTTSGPAPEWIGRLRNHVGGNDLLRFEEAQRMGYSINIDYWVKREHLTEEYRVHVFDGASIRAGVKIPRAGVSPHEWIRSWDGGWMISYEGVSNAHRNLAKKAVESLGLTFGAVDIGRKADGSLIVLEVNRAPGLEGNTINAYANAIVRYLSAPR